MKKILLLPFSFIIGFSSCYYTDCVSHELSFQLIGFSDQEASRIIMRRFSKDDNFNQLIDTANLSIGFRRSNDTLFIASRIVNGQITSNYDFELFFPLANKTYRLSQITEPPSQQKKSLFKNTKEACINAITSCRLNGHIIIPEFFNIIYLTK